SKMFQAFVYKVSEVTSSLNYFDPETRVRSYYVKSIFIDALTKLYLVTKFKPDRYPSNRNTVQKFLSQFTRKFGISDTFGETLMPRISRTDRFFGHMSTNIQSIDFLSSFISENITDPNTSIISRIN